MPRFRAIEVGIGGVVLDTQNLGVVGPMFERMAQAEVLVRELNMLDAAAPPKPRRGRPPKNSETS